MSGTLIGVSLVPGALANFKSVAVSDIAAIPDQLLFDAQPESMLLPPFQVYDAALTTCGANAAPKAKPIAVRSFQFTDCDTVKTNRIFFVFAFIFKFPLSIGSQNHKRMKRNASNNQQLTAKNEGKLLIMGGPYAITFKSSFLDRKFKVDMVKKYKVI